MTDINAELPTRGDHPGKPNNPGEDPVVPPDRKTPPVEEPPKPKKITRDG